MRSFSEMKVNLARKLQACNEGLRSHHEYQANGKVLIASFCSYVLHTAYSFCSIPIIGANKLKMDDGGWDSFFMTSVNRKRLRKRGKNKCSLDNAPCSFLSEQGGDRVR